MSSAGLEGRKHAVISHYFRGGSRPRFDRGRAIGRRAEFVSTGNRFPVPAHPTRWLGHRPVDGHDTAHPGHQLLSVDDQGRRQKPVRIKEVLKLPKAPATWGEADDNEFSPTATSPD